MLKRLGALLDVGVGTFEGKNGGVCGRPNKRADMNICN